MEAPGYRYSRWDGTQNLDIDADDVLEQLADRLIDGEDPRWALQRLAREGLVGREGQRLEGLRDILERVRQARQERLSRHDLGKVVDQLREALDEIVARERTTVEDRVQQAGSSPLSQQSQDADGESSPENSSTPFASENQGVPPAAAVARGASSSPSNPADSPGLPTPAMRQALGRIARARQQQLEALPEKTGDRLRALQEYEFLDPEAAARFKELMERLRQAALGSFFQQMKQSIGNLTPEMLDRARDMVRDLNRLLQERANGGNPDASEFLKDHGDFFPGAENLDDILSQLAQQMNQMGSLMRSLSAAQRQELADMMSVALGDDRLRVDLAQLAGHFRDLIQPDTQAYPFSGDDPLGLEQALDLMGQMEGIDRANDQLRDAMRDPRLMDRVDTERLRQAVGEQTAGQFERLRDIAQILKDAGYLEERGSELKLTARAMRKIGDKALRDIFASLRKDRAGDHTTERVGSRGERADDSKPYAFGDPFHLDLRETLMNALTREGPGTPVRLDPQDFAVYRTDHSTRSATVLLIDMSRSMIYNGCARAAKRLCLALQSLIRGQYPRDAFHVVAFAAVAREISHDAVAHLQWSEYNQGTNLAHGLAIARQVLGRYPGANRQAIIVTDGEPTAHLLESGEPFFMHPAHPETTRATLREALRSARDGISLNTFMIEGGPALEDFVGQMTALVNGRAFMTDPNKLGEYVLLDYVRQRRRWVA